MSVASALEDSREAVLEALLEIEPFATAQHELAKTIAALRTYEKELPGLARRIPLGQIAVSLPFNNPLYSLVLYCFGPALAGNRVVVRPSTITANTLARLADLLEPGLLRDADIHVVKTPGSEFIGRAIDDPDIHALVFAGSWENLERLESRFPETKKLIYCGSGINPFIVASDALDKLGIGEIVALAIATRIYNSGQDCLCTERFYVHTSVADRFTESLAGAIQAIPVGQFGDRTARVVPLLGGLADRLDQVAKDYAYAKWLIPHRREGSLIFPSLVEVPLGSPLLGEEKFGPMFVVARYSSDLELNGELTSSYRFGATVCGTCNSDALATYPHVEDARSVMDVEGEDAHVPFGGAGRSGFVRWNSQQHDGPILYSIETTRPEP